MLGHCFQILQSRLFMSEPISIKQTQWQSPCLSFQRNDSLSYFLNLHHLIMSCPHSKQNLRQCKYCRSYPFSITKPFNPAQANQCQLCNSINNYPVRWQLIESSQQQGSGNNSYIVPLSTDCGKSITLILYLQLLQEQYVNMMMQALKSILPAVSLQIAILIPYKGRLAIIDFTYQQPEVTVLSKDIDISELIQDKKCKITEESVQQLQTILIALSQQFSQRPSQCNSLVLLSEIVSYFNDKSSKKIEIMVWVGKFPSIIADLPPKTLHIIPILIIDKGDQANSLIQLKRRFCQIHYLYGNEAPVQLYYKIYQVLSQGYRGSIIDGIMTLRTNQKYSGNLLGTPISFINDKTQLLQIRTSSNQKHKMQVVFEFHNEQGYKMKTVLNYEEKCRSRAAWFGHVVLISRALASVLQAYTKLPPKQRSLDYGFIRRELQAFANLYQNKTRLYEQIIHHLTNYFKEFQKAPFKMYLPFSLLFKKQILFVFYPLNQGGILYHYDGIWVEGQGEDNIQWVYQTMEVIWSPRDKKLPVFYQLCLSKEQYCYIQQ